MATALLFAFVGWHIVSFDVAANLSPKGELRVTETITVDFGNSNFHGIFRDIPTLFRGHSIRFKLLKVEDGYGNPRKYKLIRKWGKIQLKIGDPNRYVSGIQKYVIFYKVRDIVFDVEGRKRLLWNVTGNYWPVEIRNASFALVFDGEPNSIISATCYTGEYGSKEKACNVSVSDNFVHATTQRTLWAEEGFTVGIDFKENAVAGPSLLTKIWWKVSKFWMWAIPIFAFAYMFSLWWTKGREKDIGPIAPYYNPPDDLTPIEAGGLIDEKVDPSDVSGQILDLAFRGYIALKETPNGKDVVIEELKPEWQTDPKVKKYEKTLLLNIFTKGDLEPVRKKARKKPEFAKFLAEIESSGHRAVAVSSLKNEFYKTFIKIKEDVMRRLTKRGYFVENPEKVRKRFGVIAILIVFAGHLSSILLAIYQNNPWNMQLSFASFLAGGIVYLFGRAMPKRTRKGVEELRKLLGFLEFIRRAEKDRIRRLAEENFDKFKRILPYAVAFREEDKWGEVFEEMYERFESAGVRTVAITNFSHMNSMVGSSLTSSPRGGGGSGGGFSGGGAGGGGGGAW